MPAHSPEALSGASWASRARAMRRRSLFTTVVRNTTSGNSCTWLKPRRQEQGAHLAPPGRGSAASEVAVRVRAGPACAAARALVRADPLVPVVAPANLCRQAGRRGAHRRRNLDFHRWIDEADCLLAVRLARERVVERAPHCPHVLEAPASARAIGQQHEVAVPDGIDPERGSREPDVAEGLRGHVLTAG